MAKTASPPALSAFPTFAEVSPAIQGYNYNYDTRGNGQHMDTMNGLMTGDEIAGISDETHSGSAPQGYPWSGHEIPEYPWEGHEAPDVPQRGDPNLPALAANTAYPQIDPQTGSGYPYAPATQMGPPPGHAPVAAAFGGLDLGSLDAHLDSYGDLGRTKRRDKKDKSDNEKSRDVGGSNGVYTYRQFANGDVQVLATTDPAGMSLVGVRITQSGDPRRWQAITQDIGTWADYKSGRISQRVGIATQILSAGTDAYSAYRGRGQESQPRRSRGSRDASPAPYSQPSLAEGGIPTWVKVGGGIAGTALVLFVAYQLVSPTKD